MDIPYNVLIDSGTNALLLYSIQPSILVLLNEWDGNTTHVAHASYPNDIDSRFIKSIEPGAYPKWTWGRKERKFLPTRPDVLTESLRSRSELLAAKHEALSKMIFNMNIARYPIRTGIEFQETVYLTKKMQAQRFKDSEYDERGLMEYPYVVQYADFAGVSLRQAADDILLKASIDDQLLAKTELLRLKYFNKVRALRDPQSIPPIFEAFIRDCFVNAHV